MKEFFQAPIQAYQFISKMLPGTCRYYPTCSEYAKWQFEFNAPQIAILNSTLRILRCNQFFEGGIDFPSTYIKKKGISILCTHNHNYGKIRIKYWLIPAKEQNSKKSIKYFIIKDLDDTYITLPS